MTFNKPIRRDSQDIAVDAFITSTYNYFFLSLLGLATFGIVAFNHLPASYFMPVCVIDGILWILCGWFGWRNPIIIVFPLFIVITGTNLGLTALIYAESGKSEIFSNAALLTVSVFVILSMYVHITKRNFNGLIGFLIAGFWILLVGFLILAFTGSTILHVGLSVFGSIVFCGWVLFDTSRIINKSEPELSPQVAAFDLFLDIVGLFSYILDLWDLADD